MTRFFKEEFTGLAQFLQRNANETIIVLAAALFLSLRPLSCYQERRFQHFSFLCCLPDIGDPDRLTEKPSQFRIEYRQSADLVEICPGNLPDIRRGALCSFIRPFSAKILQAGAL